MFEMSAKNVGNAVVAAVVLTLIFDPSSVVGLLFTIFLGYVLYALFTPNTAVARREADEEYRARMDDDDSLQLEEEHRVNEENRMNQEAADRLL